MDSPGRLPRIVKFQIALSFGAVAVTLGCAYFLPSLIEEREQLQVETEGLEAEILSLNQTKARLVAEVEALQTDKQAQQTENERLLGENTRLAKQVSDKKASMRALESRFLEQQEIVDAQDLELGPLRGSQQELEREWSLIADAPTSKARRERLVKWIGAPGADNYRALQQWLFGRKYAGTVESWVFMADDSELKEAVKALGRRQQFVRVPAHLLRRYIKRVQDAGPDLVETAKDKATGTFTVTAIFLDTQGGS